MPELTDREKPNTKRLVLGFDAGCMTCSELAQRIEEQVGDKLEVRSLRDPQVQEWRKKALGEDAPWAPTLIEIKGLRVRAWTGCSMGLALGRSLGPLRTWRVMQVLEEIGAVSKAEESPIARAVASLTRRQFLKGVAGTAVAVSIVPGALMFSSTAEAKKRKGLKDATPEQREKALKIVHDSNQYQNLKEDLRRKADRSNANYDFDNAQVRVPPNSYFATVRLEAAIEEKIVSSAVFRVNYREKTARLVGGAHYTPNVRGETRGEIKVRAHVNAKSSPTYPDYKIGVYREGRKVNSDYIKTADGEKKSLAEFKKEIQRYNSQQPIASGQGVSQQRATQDTVTTQQYSEEFVQCARDLQTEYNSEDKSCAEFGLATFPILAGLALFPPTAPASIFGGALVGAVEAGCYLQTLGRPDPFEECQGL